MAYAAGDTPFVAGFWRTLDGGQTWAARTAPVLPPTPEPVPVIGWIQSGHPDWVFAGDSRFAPVLGSRNGGQSWGLEPLAGTCVLTIAWAPGSKTRGQAGCGGPSLFAVDPARAPWDQAFGPAQHLLIDHTGSGALISTEPLGRINADWSFVSACTATMWPGFCNSGQNDVHDAWAAGGHVTYGYSDGHTVWAKLDDGRWWKLPPPPGSEKAPMTGPLVLLSHAQLIANGLLVPLQAPSAAPPLLALQGPSLYCTVELTADDADIAYAWLRDGAAIPGTRTDHPFVAADLGHDLTCVVTARNDWGSTALVSAPYRVSPTTVIATTAKTRLALTGSAVPGKLLRCGARTGISWLRDGRALKGRHAPTYRVRESDRRPHAGLPGTRLRRGNRALAGGARAASARWPRPAGRLQALTSTSAALWPPKPKLFESEARTSTPRRAAPIDVIEAAAVVGLDEVERRRHDAAHDRQQRGGRLDAARAAERVAVQRLGGRDRGVRQAGALDRARLGGVARRRRGGVRADVADVLGAEARVVERRAHGGAGAGAGLVGVGQVRGVAARAVAGQLGVDARAARERVLALLEHEHARALADHEAVALGVERAARALGAVAQRRERAEVAVAGQDDGRDGGVGTAGEHRVGAPGADQPERGADGVGAGGAGGAGRRRRAAQLQRAGDRGAGGVGQRERDHERADAVGAALEVRAVGLVERAHAAVRASRCWRRCARAAGRDRRPRPRARAVPRRWPAARSDPCGASRAGRTAPRRRSP